MLDNANPAIDVSWYQRPPGIKERISAGGVVLRRHSGRVYLALAREGHFPLFVLPKGRVEPGETLEAAARREILEEVGISDLRLVGKLAVLERLSYNKTFWLHVHCFLFCTSQTEGVPTDRDHHDQLWWFPIDDLPPMLWPEQRQLILDHQQMLAAACADSTKP